MLWISKLLPCALVLSLTATTAQDTYRRIDQPGWLYNRNNNCLCRPTNTAHRQTHHFRAAGVFQTTRLVRLGNCD